MCKITDWYFVAKERFGYDLSFPMPYSIIRKNSNLIPILIGKMKGMTVVIDNIKTYNEIEHFLVINDESETKIFLENMHEDFFDLQEKIINGYSLVYDWSIDENLDIEGTIFSKGTFENIKDSVVYQDEDILGLKNSKEKVCVLWSTMSNKQRKYMSKLTKKELMTYAPGAKFGINNCCLNLLILIKNKEEREKKLQLLNKIDVPDFLKK